MVRHHFKVVDCSRHLCLPVALSCFVLALISGAANAFALYFLPDTANYILMGYAGATAAVGLLAVMTGFRFFTVIYLLAESLSRIPVGVVIGYTSYVLANNNSTWYLYTSYEWQLWNLGYGLLLTGDIVACVSFVISFTTLAGFRKLRLHQAGVVTAVREGRHHVDIESVDHCHHHHSPAVITVPQPTVIAVQQPQVVTIPTMVTTQPTVVVQQSSTLYPQLHTSY